MPPAAASFPKDAAGTRCAAGHQGPSDADTRQHSRAAPSAGPGLPRQGLLRQTKRCLAPREIQGEFLLLSAHIPTSPRRRGQTPRLAAPPEPPCSQPPMGFVLMSPSPAPLSGALQLRLGPVGPCPPSGGSGGPWRQLARMTQHHRRLPAEPGSGSPLTSSPTQDKGP